MLPQLTSLNEHRTNKSNNFEFFVPLGQSNVNSCWNIASNQLINYTTLT